MAEKTFRQKVQAMADKELARLKAKKKQYWEEWQFDGIVSREKKYNEINDKIDEIEAVLDPVDAKYLRTVKRERDGLQTAISLFKTRIKNFEQEEIRKENADKDLINRVMSIVNTYFP